MQKESYTEATITRRIRFLKTMVNKGATYKTPNQSKKPSQSYPKTKINH